MTEQGDRRERERARAVDQNGLAVTGGASRIERSETLTGSASTAASSQTASGTANNWETCAPKHPACAPAAAAQAHPRYQLGRAANIVT